MTKILVLYTFTKAHVKYIKNQVTDRAQKVVVNRESSLNGNIFNVTLQGSVRAPMLFITFGSDLEINMKLFLVKFVGGTKIDVVRMGQENKVLSVAWLIVPVETKFPNSFKSN